MSQDNNEAASVQSATDEIMHEVANNPDRVAVRAKVAAEVRKAVEAASASQSSTPVPRVGGPDEDLAERQAAAIRADLKRLENCVESLEPEDQAAFYNLRAYVIANLHGLAHVARQRQESEAEALSISQVVDVLRIVREMPIFDEGGPIADMIDKALATPSAAVAEGVDTALPEPLSEVRAKFRGEWDYAEAGDNYYSLSQLQEYGAQQREAGRRDLVDELRTLCGKFGWRDDGSGAVLLDRIAHQVRDLKACIAAHDSLSRQPVSEGLTEDEITKVRAAKYSMVDALINSGMRYGSCGVVSHHMERMIDALSAVPPAKAEGMSDEQISNVIREVAELPDRDSPADQPEMMLVSADELRAILAQQAKKGNQQ